MKINKEVIIKLCASFVLFVLLVMGLYAFISNKEKQNIDNTSIPEIKENYTSTTLEKYLEYNSKINYINNKFQIENDNEKYYVYFDNNTISYEKVNELKINKNYTIQTNEKTNQQYIINNKNNTISDMYDSITEITFDNKTYSYLLLSVNETNQIMNLETDEIIDLDENIIYLEDPYEYKDNKKYIKSNKYLITVNNGKYGVIDYNGNTILDLKYDYIKIIDKGFIIKENSKFGIINENKEYILNPEYQEIFDYKNNYVIKKNNKYAIINQNKETVVNYEIDYIEQLEDYLIIIKNNRLGIFKDNKILLNYQIETKNNQITAYLHNNDIHIKTYNNTIKTYIINNDRIKKTIDGDLKIINITDYKTEQTSNILNEYTYTTKINNNKLNLTIYNKDYDKYYEYNLELNDNNVEPTLTKNYSNNNFKLNLEYNEKLETYYFDLDKRIVLNEYNAISNYLENGYKFTLNDNHELRIYKNDELISKHNNIEYYIGGYYFSGTNGIIYKLEFKNESNN